MIHKTAIVHRDAEIGNGCEIGPYCVVGAGVVLADGCALRSHVVLDGPSRIGKNNTFYPFGAIGLRSQDLKYAGEPTFLEIGDGNTFREFVTIHRATAANGRTRIGDRNNFLAYAHVAHDCVVGSGVIMSNCGTLGGHVVVEDHAVIGGLAAVHQFCRIGGMAIVGGCSKVVQDIPPYMLADGNPAEVRAINKVGLERHGVREKTRKTIQAAFKLLYRESGLNIGDAVAKIRRELPDLPEIRRLCEFVGSSERGISR